MNVFVIALIAGLSGMLGWGISDFFAKKSIDKIGDLKTLIGSQIIGGVFLLSYFLFIGSPIPIITRMGVLYIFLLSVLDGMSYLFLYKAF
ncbi:MAG: EamA family transporter [Patescibacteria group bacterium]